MGGAFKFLSLPFDHHMDIKNNNRLNRATSLNSTDLEKGPVDKTLIEIRDSQTEFIIPGFSIIIR